MRDELTDRLRDEIRKALPSLTADELCNALNEAARLKEEMQTERGTLAMCRAELKETKAKLAECASIASRLASLEIREAKAKEKEESLALREGLIALREKHAEERVKEMRGVVSEVFANSKLKYSVNRMVPVPQQNGGFVSTYDSSESGEKEV